MRSIYSPALTVGLALAGLAPGAAPADTVYKSLVIAKAGDKAGDVALDASPQFQLAGLNDKEQLLFVATDAALDDLLFQYAGGKLAPVVKPGDQAGDVRINTISSDYESLVRPNEIGHVTFPALDAD